MRAREVGSSMARCGSKLDSAPDPDVEVALRDVVTTLVLPAQPSGDAETHVSVCELCGLDLMMANLYVPVLLLFDGAGPSGLASLVEELKQSLGKVLVPFYPLAGRVVQRPGQPPRLVCNNAGAVFTSAHADAPMARVCGVGVGGDFRPAGPQISGIFRRNACVDMDKLHQAADSKVEMELEQNPALVVQVTGFECGGVALAINWLHTVADGFAGSQFLKAWSDACASSGSLGLGRILVQPEHRRAQVLTKAHFLDGDFSHQDLAADYTPPGLEAVVWTRDMPAVLQAFAATMPALQTPIVRLVHYTDAAIRKLKALTSTGPGQHFSTFTCVSAHLWQCVTRARLHNIRETDNREGSGTCIFRAAVDARLRRTKSSSSSASSSSSSAGPDGSTTLLPASYFGNGILVAETREVDPEEVVMQPLGFAASLIKDCVARIDLRAYQYLLALGDKHGPRKIMVMPRPVVHDFVTSSWYRFPLYDLHFCFPAQPVLAVANFIPSPYIDGFAVLLPSPLGPNSLTAMLFANASVMANFLLDQEFLEYAS